MEPFPTKLDIIFAANASDQEIARAIACEEVPNMRESQDNDWSAQREFCDSLTKALIVGYLRDREKWPLARATAYDYLGKIARISKSPLIVIASATTVGREIPNKHDEQTLAQMRTLFEIYHLTKFHKALNDKWCTFAMGRYLLLASKKHQFVAIQTLLSVILEYTNIHGINWNFLKAEFVSDSAPVIDDNDAREFYNAICEQLDRALAIVCNEVAL